jgi:probable HAF family extracellular repeat protein
MIDLGTGFGSGSSSMAWGINSGGQVVGERRSQSSPTRATLWQNGTIQDLGTLGGTATSGTESIAYAINDSGQVVGAALPSDGYPLHGFVWQNGVMRDLGTLGGNDEATHARDIANTGQIVGSSQNDGGETHAFSWIAGAMTDLGTLGGTYSTAYGVNEHGQIVGGSRTPDSPRPGNAGHAVLWTDGLMIDLNEHVTNLPADVALETARSINDDGVIVGTTCTLLCEPGKTAPRRGFLLVPQPGTA